MRNVVGMLQPYWTNISITRRKSMNYLLERAFVVHQKILFKKFPGSKEIHVYHSVEITASVAQTLYIYGVALKNRRKE